jgi:hypothetical protein
MCHDRSRLHQGGEAQGLAARIVIGGARRDSKVCDEVHQRVVERPAAQGPVCHDVGDRCAGRLRANCQQVARGGFVPSFRRGSWHFWPTRRSLPRLSTHAQPCSMDQSWCTPPWAIFSTVSRPKRGCHAVLARGSQRERGAWRAVAWSRKIDRWLDEGAFLPRSRDVVCRSLR